MEQVKKDKIIKYLKPASIVVQALLFLGLGIFILTSTKAFLGIVIFIVGSGFMGLRNNSTYTRNIQ